MLLKETLLLEALRLFSTKGYMATSINDVIVAAGTSKGGLYNHFKNKEELLLAVLDRAREIWRQRNLVGIEEGDRPIARIRKILCNYRDNYLVDAENFPGGCIFVKLVVELSDQQPDLAAQIDDGFVHLKGLLLRLLKQEQERGGLRAGVDIEGGVALLFSGLLGACVIYGADKSEENLQRTIGAMLDFLDTLVK